MGGKIQVLSENIIHKIAAGEVIERPASIVKELLENAIDAQAGRISATLKAGGRQALVVADNGVGMTREDLLLCACRHATSKMASPMDLFNIHTLGFRGEALASIGAISQLTIETRAREENEGTRLVVEGGLRRQVQPMGRAVGTTVGVRQLFFNTPARRKFLRSVDTEIRYITQTLMQLAAGYPHIGFTLEHQERAIASYGPSTPTQRAAEILGLESGVLLEVAWEEEGIRVQGVLSPPAACRKTRGRQFLLVRGRPVVARKLCEALYRGYGGLLPEDRHPSFVVWLELDPAQIDVNVHPTKREIRFADEAGVAQVIEAGVRKALDLPETNYFLYERNTSQPVRIGESAAWQNDAEQVTEAGSSGDPARQLSLSLLTPQVPKVERWGGQIGQGEKAPGLSQAGPLCQLHDRYLLVLVEDGLVLMDQRAAHERILYEENLAALSGGGAQGQTLLFPLTVQLDPGEWAVLQEALELLGSLGFAIREFGRRTILVESVPVELRNWGEGEMLYKILSDVQEEKQAGSELRQAVAMSCARRAAVGSPQALSREEMEFLLDRLMKTQDPFTDPRGRPTMVKVALKDLDRMFGRA
jgi:DNA mismatch repair protein MutL